jgi:hypothetical protein
MMPRLRASSSPRCDSGDTTKGVNATNNTRLVFDNIMVYQPGIAGMELYSGGNDCLIKNVKIFGKSASTLNGIFVNLHNNVVIDSCYVEYCNGGTGAYTGGIQVLGGVEVHISNCTTRLNSGTSNAGVYIQSTASRCTVSNHTSYQDYYAIWDDGSSYNTYENILAYDSYNIGFNLTGDYLNFSNLRAYSVGSFGLWCSGDYCTGSGLYSVSSTNIGLNFNGALNGTFSALGSYLSGAEGMYISACYYSSFTGISLRDSTSRQLYMNNADVCIVSDISVSSGSNDGVFISGCDWAVIDGAILYDNASDGIVVTQSPGITVSDVVAYNNGAFGIYCITNCQRASFNDIKAYGNTSGDLYFGAIGGANGFVHGYAYNSMALGHGDWNFQDGRNI